VTVASSATMLVSNNISVGFGGVGTLTLKDNTTNLVTGDLNVADLTGAVGVLNITNNTQLSLNTLYVGKTNNGVGTVNQSGGIVTRLGGGDWRIGGGYTAGDNSAVGTYNLSGGSIWNVGNLQIGAAAQGTWNQSGGSVSVAAYPSIGRFTNSVG